MSEDSESCDHYKTSILNVAKYADYLLKKKARFRNGFELYEKHKIVLVALRKRKCEDCKEIIQTVEIPRQEYEKLIEEATNTKDILQENRTLRMKVDALEKLLNERNVSQNTMKDGKYKGDTGWVSEPTTLKDAILRNGNEELVVDFDNYTAALKQTINGKYEGTFTCKGGEKGKCSCKLFEDGEGIFLLGSWHEKSSTYTWWARLQTFE